MKARRIPLKLKCIPHLKEIKSTLQQLIKSLKAPSLKHLKSRKIVQVLINSMIKIKIKTASFLLINERLL